MFPILCFTLAAAVDDGWTRGGYAQLTVTSAGALSLSYGDVTITAKFVKIIYFLDGERENALKAWLGCDHIVAACAALPSATQSSPGIPRTLPQS